MDIHNATGLKHQFPDETVADALIEVTDIDSGFFVLFPGMCELVFGDLERCEEERYSESAKDLPVPAACHCDSVYVTKEY